MKVTKMSKWIPTSVRYPNHAGDYIATVELNCGMKEVAIVKFRLDGRNKKPFFYNPFTQSVLNVTAWMKIPEPYETSVKERS